MRQTNISNAIIDFFADNNINVKATRCTNGQIALNSVNWHTFADMEAAAELYNKHVDADMLHVGIIAHRAGNASPEVYDDWAINPVDAAYVYNDRDDNDTHVVVFDDIDDEHTFLSEGADDMDDDEGTAYLNKLAAEFAKISAKMTADDVLIYNGNIIDGDYEIAPRCPMSWADDAKIYNYQLVISSKFND